jgi:hypothetical protein
MVTTVHDSRNEFPLALGGFAFEEGGNIRFNRVCKLRADKCAAPAS